MRRLTPIVGLLALLTTLGPTIQAHAQTRAITVALTTTVDFWSDSRLIGDPTTPAHRVELWAPAGPACGAGACPVPDLPFDHFDYVSSAGGTCVIEDSAFPAPQSCSASIKGDFAPLLGLGPWCGYAWGNIQITLTSPGRTYKFSGTTQGTSHAGPALAWKAWNSDVPGDLNNAGEIVGLVTGAHFVDGSGAVHPGSCGLEPPDFLPANRYDLALTVAWSDPQ